MKVAIPRAFAQDRIARDLPMPKDGTFKKHLYIGNWSDAELADLISDARYYATDVDEAPPRIIRAAKLLLLFLRTQGIITDA
jgi:hypothetical protein